MDTIDEAIDAHFDSLGSTLFGRSFDVTDEGSRAKARAWFRKHLLGVVSKMNTPLDSDPEAISGRGGVASRNPAVDH